MSNPQWSVAVFSRDSGFFDDARQKLGNEFSVRPCPIHDTGSALRKTVLEEARLLSSHPQHPARVFLFDQDLFLDQSQNRFDTFRDLPAKLQKRAPIVVLATFDEGPDRVDAYNAGARFVVPKGFQRDEIVPGILRAVADELDYEAQMKEAVDYERSVRRGQYVRNASIAILGAVVGVMGAPCIGPVTDWGESWAAQCIAGRQLPGRLECTLVLCNKGLSTVKGIRVVGLPTDLLVFENLAVGQRFHRVGGHETLVWPFSIRVRDGVTAGTIAMWLMQHQQRWFAVSLDGPPADEPFPLVLLPEEELLALVPAKTAPSSPHPAGGAQDHTRPG